MLSRRSTTRMSPHHDTDNHPIGDINKAVRVEKYEVLHSTMKMRNKNVNVILEI